MVIKKKSPILLGLSLTLALSAGQVQAQSTEFSFSHTLPATHPIHTTGFVPWAESITEATNGEVTFSFFPAGQMGVGRDQFEMVTDGIVDVSWFNPGHTPGRFPIVAALELPFLVSDGLNGSQAFDEWYREYAPAEMPDVYFCLAHTHEPGVIHTRQPLRTPSDLRGMRIRPANATLTQFLQSQGGSSIQVGPSEAREVLARRTADGITFPWRSIFVFGMEDYVKHHIDLPFYTPTFVIALNQAKYDGLSDANKAVIDDHCNSEWAREITRSWSEFDMEGKDMLLAADDHTVYEPTDVEAEQWRGAAAKLKVSWEESVQRRGLDPEEIFNGLMERLEAHGALF